jgi:hypothetical protein
MGPRRATSVLAWSLFALWAVVSSATAWIGMTADPIAALQAVNRWADLALLLCLALSALSLVVRFRRSSGAERQQLKWFASAIVLAAMGFAAAGVEPQVINETGWWLFLLVCVLGIPLATGIAVFRYRLYDIDLVINRTLVYGTLTAGLAMTYVASILLLRLLLNPFTGETDLAVAGSTLVVAVAFRPARASVQAAVDRRFYRRRYDAVLTLDEFSARLRHELDLDAVGDDLCTTTDQTMQPTHVSLWVRESHR